MIRAASVDEDRETVELAAEDAERVLARDPGLRRVREVDCHDGRGGRLIVLDGERVRRALALEDGTEGAR